MPIGKSAIKRVSNNGYSKVVSKAPDMENSAILEADKTAPVSDKTAAKPVKPATARSTAKKPAAKKPAAKKPAPKKPAAEVKTENNPAAKKAVEPVAKVEEKTESKPAAKKAAAKKPVAKVENKPVAEVKTEAEVKPEAKKLEPTPIKGGPSAVLASEGRYQVGEELPPYLL